MRKIAEGITDASEMSYWFFLLLSQWVEIKMFAVRPMCLGAVSSWLVLSTDSPHWEMHYLLKICVWLRCFYGAWMIDSFDLLKVKANWACSLVAFTLSLCLPQTSSPEASKCPNAVLHKITYIRVLNSFLFIGCSSWVMLYLLQITNEHCYPRISQKFFS